MRLSHTYCATPLSALLGVLFGFSGSIFQARAQPQPCGGTAYARIGNSFYIQGGASSGDNLLLGLWALDLTSTWTTSKPAWTALPLGPANAYHSAGYSADNQSFITFGRDTAADPHVIPPNWINVYNIATGTWSFSANPPNMNDNSRRDFNVVTNPAANKIYILGGDAGPAGAIYSNMFDVYDTTSRTLTEITTPRMGPQNVSTYAAVWVPRLNTMVVIGGQYSGGSVQSLYLYRPDSGAWTTQATTGTFNYARFSHCAASNMDGSLVVVYGGFTGQGAADPYVYILDTVTWTWTSTVYPGRGRGNTACALVDDTFIIWGGFYSTPNTLNGTPLGTEALLLFSLSKKSWVTTYTPSAALAGSGGTSGTSTGGGTGSGDGNAGTSTNANAQGMSAGAIGGIAAGGVSLLLILAFAFLERNKRRKKRVALEKVDPDTSEPDLGHGYPYNNADMDEHHLQHHRLAPPRPSPPYPSGKYQSLSLAPEPLQGNDRPSVERYNDSDGYSDPATPTNLQFLNTGDHSITAAEAGGPHHYERHSYQSDGISGSPYYPPPPGMHQQPTALDNMPYRQSFANSNLSIDRRSNDPHAIVHHPVSAVGQSDAYYPFGNVSATASGAGISAATTTVEQYHDGGYGKHASTISGYSDATTMSSSNPRTPHSSDHCSPPPPILMRPVSGPQSGFGFGSALGQPVPGAPHAIIQQQPSFHRPYQPPLSPHP